MCCEKRGISFLNIILSYFMLMFMFTDSALIFVFCEKGACWIHSTENKKGFEVCKYLFRFEV